MNNKQGANQNPKIKKRQKNLMWIIDESYNKFDETVPRPCSSDKFRSAKKQVITYPKKILNSTLRYSQKI